EDRVVVQVAAQLTLIARYVRANRAPSEDFASVVDFGFGVSVFAGLLALALFWAVMRVLPPIDPRKVDEAARQQPPRAARYQAKPPPPEAAPKKAKEGPGAKEGARAAEPEGKIGKKEAKR